MKRKQLMDRRREIHHTIEYRTPEGKIEEVNMFVPISKLRSEIRKTIRDIEGQGFTIESGNIIF